MKTHKKRSRIFSAALVLCIVLVLLISMTNATLAAETHKFQFEVTVDSGDLSFTLPDCSSPRVNTTYSWTIDWGDGNTGDYTGIGSVTSNGISHTYGAAETYTITITPKSDSSTEAWLAAFGFAGHTSGAANIQSNKDKVTCVIGPIEPSMTRTNLQLVGDAYTPPNSEWSGTFYGCTNLTMDARFKFSDEWNSIERVGDTFAASMFYGCSGDAFTMNATFNLPQGITSVGNSFALDMFRGCSGASFTMNDVFTMPQSIIITGESFARLMFANCTGSAFTMGAVFNLPASTTTVDSYFAQEMFKGCTGDVFTMNDVITMPANIDIGYYYFGSSMFEGCNGAVFTMGAAFNLPTNLSEADSYFGHAMFKDCSGDAFSMNDVFNTPSSVTLTRAYFLDSMFRNCSGASFTMNDIFTMPQTITFYQDAFATYMFLDCSGDAFTMNDVFTMPQNTSFEVSDSCNSFGSSMFKNCSGAAFTMGDAFNLPPYLKKVRRNFARAMFNGCSGDAFNMNATFTLPQSLTEVENQFAYEMFAGCTGNSFTMNDVFNMPTALTSVGDYFAYGMFRDCSNDTFAMNDVCTLPATVSTINYNFASSMFENCSGDAFTMGDAFNLPTTIEDAYSYFAKDIFKGCSGNAFNMNEVFNLPTTISVAGSFFASNMFENCSGAAFTMNDVFTMPQTITTLETWFGANLFKGCSGDAFTMNEVFNFPAAATSGGSFIAYLMFSGCSGDAFTMNDVFTLPANLTVSGSFFAYQMFYNSKGNAFTMGPAFNLPQGITTAGTDFASGMFDYAGGPSFQINDVFTFPVVSAANSFYQTFYRLQGNAQTRLAASIIGDNARPNSNMETFTYTDRMFADRGSIHANWGGVVINAPSVIRNFTVTAGDEQLRLSWDAPNGDGGDYITGYEVTAGDDVWIPTNSTDTSYTITGLNNGQSYLVNARAVNSVGSGAVGGYTWATPRSPRSETQQFRFKVTVSPGDLSFAIPVSGRLNATNNAYNWTIDWGDGTTEDHSGTGSTTSAGISHSYATAKSYTITIAPKSGSSTNAWLAAFGFYENTNGANSEANKNKVTSLIGPIEPGMTRTDAQIDGQYTPPTYEWCRTFYGCTNLTMDAALEFSNDWNDNIKIVGTYFAAYMFYGCSGNAFNMNSTFNLPQAITSADSGGFATHMFDGCSGSAFTMNDVFNLPQGIAEVRNNFASAMFANCSGSAFNMNNRFNLPQNITIANDYFAYQMFSGCSGNTFTMNDVFNLPTNITTFSSNGSGFAREMFSYCAGNAFTMNDRFTLPPDITSVGDLFANAMFEGCAGNAFTMNNVFNLPQGITSTGLSFASAMFYKAGGSSFQVNDIFTFPVTSVHQRFYNAFRELAAGTPTQNRTAASIIGRTPTPTSGNLYTFTGSNVFVDRPNLHIFWGGDGSPLTLTGITPPAAITNVASGTAKDAASLGLPATVTMTTSGNNVQANVAWDVASCSYDPESIDVQTFVVSGTAALPASVTNPNGVSLATSISVATQEGLATVPQTITKSTYDTAKPIIGELITSTDGTYTPHHGGTAGSHLYQWKRSDHDDRTGDVTDLATTKDYTLTNADFGKYIWLETTPVGNGILTGVAVQGDVLRVGIKLTITITGGSGGTDPLINGSAAGTGAVVYDTATVSFTKTEATDTVQWSAAPDEGSLSDPTATSTDYTPATNPSAGTIALTATVTPIPDLQASADTVSFGDVFSGISSTPETLTVSGTDLKGTISYAIDGADASFFNVTETDWAAATGGTLSITFNPTEERAYSATLIISTTGALDKEIALSGTGTPPPVAPDAPTGLTATAGDCKLVLSWTPPISDGGSEITKYQYSVTTAADSWTDMDASGPTTTEYTMTDLTPGTTYTVKVRAVNVVGHSAEASTTGTPFGTVTYTATQVGGVYGYANTTGIQITFSQAVTGLSKSDITVTGATKGALSGSGDTYTLAVEDLTVANGANATIEIADFGAFEVSTIGAQNVAVYIVFPPLAGTVAIDGTSRIGQTLMVDTTDITGGSGEFSYQWKVGSPGQNVGANQNVYTIQGDDAGKSIACVVTRAEASGSIEASFDSGTVVPYDIAVTNHGAEVGDTDVAASPEMGREGDEITLRYALGDGDGMANNVLTFSGATGLANLTTAGESIEQIYTVNAADAVNGVITIAATFQHTNLIPRTLSFTDSGPVTLTYGGTYFVNAATPSAGAGTLQYESSVPTVATVDKNSGAITIVSAGQTTITATIASDGTYAESIKSYLLTVEKADQAAPTGLGKTDETAAGANDGTITGADSTMEYKKQGDGEYVAVSGTEITNLAPGTYLLRYAAKPNYNAGADATITVASYVAPTVYTISASAGANGSISPSGSVKVNEGDSQTFSITPNHGYKISQVLVDGANNGAAVSSGSYTFASVAENHTISVVFASVGGEAIPSDTTTEIGGSTVTTPPNQDPIKHEDGTTTLPGGGSVSTGEGTTIDVPAGTVIDENGAVILPDDKGAEITLPDNETIITVPGGSTISDTGAITVGNGEATIELPNHTEITLPKGSTIDGKKVTVGAGGATITTADGETVSVGDGEIITVDAKSPLGYYIQENWPFIDVASSDWFYEAVKYVYENGIMQGTSASTFAPDTELTRGMMATMLWRLESEPKALSENPFVDLTQDWYIEAVIWAAENSIVNGYGNSRFGPEDAITREQMAAMLFRYCQYKGIELSTVREHSSFDDANSVSPYATEAVQAMYEAGILNGKGNNLFDPQGTATRAEVAQMLTNFMQKIK